MELVIDLDKRRPPATDNAWAQEALTELVKMLDDGQQVTSIGIAFTLADGSVGTRYIGDSYVDLLGALEVLKTRVAREFE